MCFEHVCTQIYIPSIYNIYSIKRDQLKTIDYSCLYCYNFTGIDFNPNKYNVVFHKMSLLQHLVRYEFGKTETQRVRLLAGPLEIFPCRIGNEAFDNVARLLRTSGLIEQREGYRMSERPP